METTAALAADLATLSEALDETDPDITEALRQLVADVRLAVRSYLGLTVTSGDATPLMNLTAMEGFAHPDDVVSSLMIPLSDKSADGAGLRLAVILYAARPGGFVDLAADLGWLTGRRLSDFALDQHLSGPARPTGGVRSTSLINQAIGVLLGRGYTLEQAALEIDERAAAAGHSRSEAADVVLGSPPCNEKNPTPDAR